MTNTNKTFALATKHNATGAIVNLDLPLMARNQAESHANKLRKLMPQAPVYVINVTAE